MKQAQQDPMVLFELLQGIGSRQPEDSARFRTRYQKTVLYEEAEGFPKLFRLNAQSFRCLREFRRAEDTARCTQFLANLIGQGYLRLHEVRKPQGCAIKLKHQGQQPGHHAQNLCVRFILISSSILNFRGMG